ncbi:MAG TPA: uroporphyrinogen-III synthase [Mizugakiibacter sp.]|nr:uroporphyrinogen-III synthase [Mizugakiibacter sp.]
MAQLSTHCPLLDTQVIVTRAGHAAGILSRQLRRLGAEVLPLAGYRLVPAAKSAVVHQQLAVALRADVCIFSSPAAVTFAARSAVLQPGPSRCVVALGQATARTLRRHGVRQVVTPARQDSEGVLALPELALLRGHTVAIVGAPGGRGLLQQALRQQGAKLLEAWVYARIDPRIKAGQRGALRALCQPCYALLSSVESIQRLQAVLGPKDFSHLRKAIAIASSARVADAACQAGFSPPYLATSALAKDLLTALLQVHIQATRK